MDTFNYDQQLERMLHPENFERHEAECENSTALECICEEIRLRRIDEEPNDDLYEHEVVEERMLEASL